MGFDRKPYENTGFSIFLDALVGGRVGSAREAGAPPKLRQNSAKIRPQLRQNSAKTPPKFRQNIRHFQTAPLTRADSPTYLPGVSVTRTVTPDGSLLGPRLTWGAAPFGALPDPGEGQN